MLRLPKPANTQVSKKPQRSNKAVSLMPGSKVTRTPTLKQVSTTVKTSVNKTAPVTETTPITKTTPVVKTTTVVKTAPIVKTVSVVKTNPVAKTAPVVKKYVSEAKPSDKASPIAIRAQPTHHVTKPTQPNPSPVPNPTPSPVVSQPKPLVVSVHKPPAVSTYRPPVQPQPQHIASRRESSAVQVAPPAPKKRGCNCGRRSYF